MLWIRIRRGSSGCNKRSLHWAELRRSKGEWRISSRQEEANLGRLKDILAQLSALGGIEAAIEGFGAQLGRRADVWERLVRGNSWTMNLGQPWGDELGTMSSSFDLGRPKACGSLGAF